MKKKLAMLMMVKNEKKRIEVSMKSLVNFIDVFVIFDTGSTDNTVEIITEFCEKNKIDLRLKQGHFVDFAKSRNDLLDFADTFDDLSYYLLMDCNDELRGGKEYVEYMNKTDFDHFMLTQEWFTGVTTYHAGVRVLKSKAKARYRYRVHELLLDLDGEKLCVMELPKTIVLFQDRTLDDDKTGKRFANDRRILLEDHLKDPEEPRILFYLAQSCECLKNYEEAYYYYKLRTETKVKGFWEEIYQSYYRMGNIGERSGMSWHDRLYNYTKAYEVGPCFAEPFIKIGQYYFNNKTWHLAYFYLKKACEINYPSDTLLVKEVDAYRYYRWLMIAHVCSFMPEKHYEGYEYALKAVKEQKNKMSEGLVKFYENRKIDDLVKYIPKEKVLNVKVEEIMRKNKKLTEKAATKIAKKLLKIK